MCIAIPIDISLLLYGGFFSVTRMDRASFKITTTHSICSRRDKKVGKLGVSELVSFAPMSLASAVDETGLDI